MKKTVSAVLAALLCLLLTVPAFGEEENSTLC